MKEISKVLSGDTTPYIQEVDSATLKLMVSAAKAFARSTYQGVYVVDLFKRNFLYVSDNLETWFGEPIEDIKKKGLEFFCDHVSPREQQLLREVNSRGLAMFNSMPLRERSDYTLSYNFHILCGKKKKLIHHLITPLQVSEDGQIRFVLCSISLSHRNTTGHFVLHSMGAKSYYEYLSNEHRWKKKNIPKLSEVEREVLALSAQGYTMTDMADVLCRSVDTVKACKKKLFSKLGVRNIAGALSFVTNYKM